MAFRRTPLILLSAFVLVSLCSCRSLDDGRIDAGPGGVIQDPIEIVIENKQNFTVYLHATPDVWCYSEQPVFERLDGDSWTPVRFLKHQGYCLCPEIGQGEGCDCEGDFANPLRVLVPGAKMIIPWDGKVFTQNEDIPTFGYCLESEILEEGVFRATVEFHNDYEMAYGYPDEGPDEEMKIEWAYPAGTAGTKTVEFHLPTDQGTIQISLD